MLRTMSTYTKVNLCEVEDQAPKFGMDAIGQARFARSALGAERIGLAYYRMNPGKRLGFGHRHGSDEEAYLVVSGSGRFNVDGDVFDVGPLDDDSSEAVSGGLPPTSVREWEAGEDGLQLVAFGAHSDDDGASMDQEFWTD